MKSRLLIIIGIIFSGVFVIANASAIPELDYPFGDTGPVMNQDTCNSFALSQWQPTIEGIERTGKFLDICIERDFMTSEIVEIGKNADGYSTRQIEAAYAASNDNVKKTIQILMNPIFDQKLEEPNCGSNTLLTDGLCVVIDGGCEPDINGNTTWCGPQYDYLKIILSEPYAFLFAFGTPTLIAGIIIGVVAIWRKRK